MSPQTEHSARRSRRASLLLLVLVFSAYASAQVVPWRTKIAASPDAHTLPQDRGADGLAQTLRKLNTWGSMLFIVAHPDDEDGGMLAYESRGKGIRTALLTLNRGEGGQNAMSASTYNALGLIRTNELLMADEYSGTKQYFTKVVDYGFSKSIQEAHEKWGVHRVLCDVVRVVRKDRPLVLASTFTGNLTDGHGHHQVAGQMNQEAYLDAGNPAVCPQQIAAGLRPWTPLKVYARTPFFGAGPKGMYDYATNQWDPVHFYDYVTKTWSDHFPTKTLTVPEGSWDPVLGETYFQMARTGWAMQKSQNGGGTVPLAGPVNVGYHRYGSRVPTTAKEDSFFQGIDTSLAGIASLVHSGNTGFLTAGLQRIQAHVSAAIENDNPARMEKIAPELAEGYKATQNLIDAVNASSLSAADKSNVNFVLKIKLAQFNTALAESLGLHVNAILMRTTGTAAHYATPVVPRDTPTTVTRGSEIDVRVHVSALPVWGSSPEGLEFTRAWVNNPNGDRWPVTELASPGLEKTGSREGDAIFHVVVPDNAQLTKPYFTRPNDEQPYYNLIDPKWRNRPFAPYPLAGWAEFHYMGVPIRVGQVVQTVHWVHGVGGVYQPLAVVPQLSVNLAGRAGVVPLGKKSMVFPVTVKNPQWKDASGTLRLELPAGWTSSPAQIAFQLKPESRQKETFTLRPSSLAAKSYEIRAVAQMGQKQFRQGFITAGYPGLRPYYLYRPATYRLRGVDVKVPAGLKVGYIMGTGDNVPSELAQIGIRPHLLTPAEVANGNLSHYDAIILGIRTYSARPHLAAETPRLLNYVKNGGTVIVQYQRTPFPAPYPLDLPYNSASVVVESQPVRILKPNDPLLSWPNRITPADFNGWVEERGHSFLRSWSSQYTALTETHDPGQKPQLGGLIYARYGKGTWIYMAYAVYRQLPEAVPGAYRLMANLIAADKNQRLSAAAGTP